MEAKKLSPEELQQQLPSLVGWELRSGKLHREFIFKNFVEAFGFMTQMALLSEKRNHHPEWQNVYNKVHVDLVTHSAGGITSLDIEWAKAAHEAFEK